MTLHVDHADRGKTVVETARFLRVSADKVRAWIRRRELRAINTSTKGKARYVILPRDLEKFIAGRAVAVTTEEAAPRRRKRQPGLVDYYPGD
jgi:hypothetical protein